MHDILKSTGKGDQHFMLDILEEIKYAIESQLSIHANSNAIQIRLNI